MNGTETGSATLAELCDLISEQVHPADVPDALYVGLEHVAPGRLRRSGGGIAADVQSHKYAFRRNDILYGKLRPYLDKAILADTDGVCTTELLVLRAKPGVDPRFLACLVHDPDFVEHALTGVTGAHHPRTSWAHIAQFERPRFSFEEQRTIAGLLWRTQDLLRVCEDTLEAAQKLKLVAMRELFTRGLRGEPQKETEIGPVPESWEIKAIRQVFEIVQGISLKGNLSGGADGIPFLRTSNVYWGQIDLKNLSRMHVAPEAIGDRWLSRGDLLVCEGGEIGRAAVWESSEQGYTYQNHLHRLRPLDANSIEPKFAAAWLQIGFCHRRVYEGAGNKTTIPNLSRARLAELLMPVPAIDEQREIVAILDAIDRKIELHRKKREVLEELFKALLHKLMTGEIRVADLDLAALDRPDTAAAMAGEEVV
jgi:type I restriction enzyme S subunit